METRLAERVTFADHLQDLLTENDQLRAELENERFEREHLKTELANIYKQRLSVRRLGCVSAKRANEARKPANGLHNSTN